MDKEKRFGQIFTPPYLVDDILDFSGYSGSAILHKHAIDNSCGDGAFLVAMARRYCDAFSCAHDKDDKKTLAKQLGKFIHGIEKDEISHAACMARMRQMESELSLPPVNWDIRCADALRVRDFDGHMDFVIGNPPYVRVHNLENTFAQVKQHAFCGGGMTDLYLVFYEIGLNMLASGGRLCYIAPSSWINSVAGQHMRAYLQSTGCLRAIADLGHFQPFNATTYTAITLLEKNQRTSQFAYYVYEGERKLRFVDNLPYDEAFFDGVLFLGSRQTLDELRAIKTSALPPRVEVKNGFATLADDVFIADKFPFARFTIPVIKASTGAWRTALYPYDGNGKPLPRDAVFADADVAAYLHAREDALRKGRDSTQCPDWHLYGRSQALKDVWTHKYAINTVIRDVSSIKLNPAPRGAGVYGGLYILTNASEQQIRKALLCDDFIRYIAALKKYKSGGYYTFNSRELKQYLNHALRETDNAHTGRKQQQMALFH